MNYNFSLRQEVFLGIGSKIWEEPIIPPNFDF